MSLPFFLINAFTLPTSTQSGNQAAVVLLPASHPRDSDDEWKRLTARDFNFAETAFVVEREDGKWGLRWWTPAVEVNLCGHATLAAATALFSLHPDEKSFTFTTRWSGDLIATRDLAAPAVDGKSQASLDVTISLPALTAEALSHLEDSDTSSTFTRISGLIGSAVPGLKDAGAISNVFTFAWSGEQSVIIELDGDVSLASLKPDIKGLVNLLIYIQNTELTKQLSISKGLIILTQIITSENSAGKMVIRSRVFAPGVGIDEDPVTGAAHAFLTAYYLSPTIFRRLPSAVIEGRKPTDIVLDAYQMSERQGRLECRLREGGRVELTGKGAIWGKGHLNI